jgi:hypothetical protein
VLNCPLPSGSHYSFRRSNRALRLRGHTLWGERTTRYRASEGGTHFSRGRMKNERARYSARRFTATMMPR